MCGLTGAPSCMLTPAFLIAGKVARCRIHFVSGLILSLCCCVQLLILHNLGPTGRPFYFSFTTVLMAASVKTFLAPVLGNYLTSSLQWRIGAIAHPYVQVVANAVLTCSLPLYWAVSLAVLRTSNVLRPALLIIGCWALVTLLNSTASLRGMSILTQPASDIRYFFFGATCFCLVTALVGSHATHSWIRFSYVAVLCLIAFADLRERVWGADVNWYLHGPNWREQAFQCGAGPCVIQIWPDVSDWVVHLPL